MQQETFARLTQEENGPHRGIEQAERPHATHADYNGG